MNIDPFYEIRILRERRNELENKYETLFRNRSELMRLPNPHKTLSNITDEIERINKKITILQKKNTLWHALSNKVHEKIKKSTISEEPFIYYRGRPCGNLKDNKAYSRDELILIAKDYGIPKSVYEKMDNLTLCLKIEEESFKLSGIV